MPILPLVLSVVGVGAIGLASIALIGFALLIMASNLALALFLMMMACLLAALAGYVGRDLGGKWGLRVGLDRDAVTLDLPAGRSLINRPPEQHLTIGYSDIEAIETRLEAYTSLGTAMMQRAYVLRLRSGDLVFLFEDRALATGLASSYFADIAAALAARAGVPLRDLGMVEGAGGVLGVWGTRAVDWAAPSLPLARQLRLWRHAAATGAAAIAVVIVAIVVRVFAGLMTQ